MSLMESILSVSKPPDWSTCNYGNKRYVKFELENHSLEYQRIKTEFSRRHSYRDVIISIERIQHPYAYASYQLRKEHLSVKHRHNVKDEREFLYILHEGKVADIIEYNCDARRGRFFKTSCTHSNGGYVLLIKTVGDMNERDSHRYPDYLIKYKTSRIENEFAGLRLY